MAAPPVCRIMDYGKWKYEAAQQAKESRRKSIAVSIKEMKYRPKIGTGDFETKTRQVEKFLGQGHKVKVTIMFRGREMQHPDLGQRILDRVAVHVAHVGRVELMPKLDGRNMVMVLAPDKRAKAAWDKARAEADGLGEPVAANGATPAPTPATEPAGTPEPVADVEPDPVLDPAPEVPSEPEPVPTVAAEPATDN